MYVFICLSIFNQCTYQDYSVPFKTLTAVALIHCLLLNGAWQFYFLLIWFLAYFEKNCILLIISLMIGSILMSGPICAYIVDTLPWLPIPQRILSFRTLRRYFLLRIAPFSGLRTLCIFASSIP